MGLLDKIKNKEVQPSPVELELMPNQLTTQEIGVLLQMIKKTTFLGEDIETLYNLIIKLQNQYIDQTK
jgi:hypothetical protein